MNPTPILETTLNNTRIFVYDELFDIDLIPTNSLNIYLLDFKTDSYCPGLRCSSCYFKIDTGSCISNITKFLHSTFEHSHPEAFV